MFAHLYRRCQERGLATGVAPNVHVSLVLTPDECRWLLPPAERGRWKLRRLRNLALRTAAGVLVGRRIHRITQGVD